MNRTYKTEGIILKRTNIGETDRLITVFTKNYGKTKIIAKGIRKINSRRAPSLELFSHTRLFIYRGKTFDLVNDTQAISTHQHIRKNLDRIASAFLITELLDRLLADGQENRKIFNVVLTMLDKLNDNTAPFKMVEAYMNRFKFFLLENLGFIPHKKIYPNFAVDNFIESIIEQKLRSKRVFQ